MIIVNNDMKICSILDNILVDPYATHSTAIEFFRTIIYNTLIRFTNFKPENKKPIRTATSLSTIKRMIAPGEDVFHTITPFGVMHAQETLDENLGALIAPEATWNPFIPYTLNTTPVYSHLKTFDVKNNVEIRLGYQTANYVVGMNMYESTRPLAFNIAKHWDWLVVPGTVYRRMVEMKVIVPRILIAEYCNWANRDVDFEWFVKDMNAKSEAAFSFNVELDTGSGKHEVMLHYATTISYRGATSGEVMAEEEMDTAKYWYFQRSFLMSLNIPTHFIFGRESDKRFEELGGDKVYVLDDDSVSYGDVKTKAEEDPRNMSNSSTKVMINTDDIIEEYELIERYILSDHELDVIEKEELEVLNIDVFGEIIIEEEPVKYKFLEYCVDKNILGALDSPIKIIIKSDNINLEVTTRYDEGSFIATTNALEKIAKDRNCCIYIYFKNSDYRVFMKEFLGVFENTIASFNIKQTS